MGKGWMFCFSMVFLAGCTPMTQLIQDGNGWVQVSQTENQWSSNAVKVTHCDVLANGFCPDGSPSYIVVMNGPLPGVVGAGISAVGMLGGAAIIADGLKGSASKTTVKQRNVNRNDVRASTVNPK